MNESIEQFEDRKRDHLEIALRLENQAEGMTGLERIVLEHEALPEFDFKDVSIQTEILGKKLSAPLFVSSMTAGHARGAELNVLLAKTCEEKGWMMGVGSQRRELSDPSAAQEWKKIRQFAPDVILLGNLGISQVIKTSVDDVKRLVESLQATAMIVHLNALQECIQPEGTPDFKNSFVALERLCRELSVPVIVKETGCGFSKKTLNRLMNVGVYAVDLSGFGGTHWGRVEGRRADENSVQAEAAKTFKNWGISTVQSMLNAIELKPTYKLWASGGMRTGLDAAKLIAMGAQAVGFAKPVLEEALKGRDNLWKWMEKREYELKISLFCTGSRNLQSLNSYKIL